MLHRSTYRPYRHRADNATDSWREQPLQPATCGGRCGPEVRSGSCNLRAASMKLRDRRARRQRLIATYTQVRACRMQERVQRYSHRGHLTIDELIDSQGLTF